MSLTDKLRNIGMGIALAGALGGAFSGCAGTGQYRQGSRIIEYSNPSGDGFSNEAPPTKKDVMNLFQNKCDIIHIDSMPNEVNGKKYVETILAGEIELESGSGKYVTEWRVNLSDVCKVYIKADRTPVVDWFVGDKVVIHTGSLHVYPLEFPDKIAKTFGDIIHYYMSQNIVEGRCEHYLDYIRRNYAKNRPLTDREKTMVAASLNNEDKGMLAQGYSFLMPLAPQKAELYGIGLEKLAGLEEISFSSVDKKEDVSRKYQNGAITEIKEGKVKKGKSKVLFVRE